MYLSVSLLVYLLVFQDPIIFIPFMASSSPQVEHFTKYGIHEFLDDESTIKKLKRPPVDMETAKTKVIILGY